VPSGTAKKANLALDIGESPADILTLNDHKACMIEMQPCDSQGLEEVQPH
jgi:hypothetical protein